MTAETSNARGEPGRFRKRPVVIEARQFFNDGSSYDLLHWINEGQHAAGREFATWQNNTIMVPTLEGQHIASPGDWIIRGVQGEFYPCKPEIFAATYEPADAPPPAAARGDVRGVLQEMRDRHVARRFKSQTLIDWADRIEAALAAEGVQAVEVEKRELAVRSMREANGDFYVTYGPFKEPRSHGEAMTRIASALSQQPEARGVVDEAMVERAYQAWRKAAVAREGNKPAIRAALTAALTGERNG